MPSRQERRRAERDATKRTSAQAGAAGAGGAAAARANANTNPSVTGRRKQKTPPRCFKRKA
jgi:hypothetical protein